MKNEFLLTTIGFALLISFSNGCERPKPPINIGTYYSYDTLEKVAYKMTIARYADETVEIARSVVDKPADVSEALNAFESNVQFTADSTVVTVMPPQNSQNLLYVVPFDPKTEPVRIQDGSLTTWECNCEKPNPVDNGKTPCKVATYSTGEGFPKISCLPYNCLSCMLTATPIKTKQADASGTPDAPIKISSGSISLYTPAIKIKDVK